MNAVRSAARAVVIWNGKVLVGSADVPQPVDVAGHVFAAELRTVCVTSVEGSIVAHVFERLDERAALAAVADVAPAAVFADVMIELGRYDPSMRAFIVRALAFERWSNRYRFCPACGFALGWTTDASAKICTNPERVHRHFPRLDPAIIVLVSDGARALLGRAARWPAGTYSTLAGFVAPGETLDAAIRREVFEEAGITVGETRYFDSEAWPFPRSLMLGFFATATTTAISLNDAELEDARWFDVGELRELQDRMKRTRPFFDTIARRLIDTWLAAQHAR